MKKFNNMGSSHPEGADGNSTSIREKQLSGTGPRLACDANPVNSSFEGGGEADAINVPCGEAGPAKSSDAAKIRVADEFAAKLQQWTKVAYESRMGKQARTDEVECRKVHVFGVPADFSPANFGRALREMGLCAPSNYFTPEWEGEGSARRLSLTCETTSQRDQLSERLRKAPSFMGLTIYSGRELPKRIAQRADEVYVPKVHRVPGQLKLQLKRVVEPASTHNPFGALDAVTAEDVWERARELALGTWNANNLSDLKLQVFTRYCAIRGLGIVAVQETKWTNKIFQGKGFKFIGTPCVDNSYSGGVGFLVAANYAKSVQDLGSSHEGQHWIRLRVKKGQDLFLCSVYMPQATNKERAMAAYEALTVSVAKYELQGTVIALGDFNAHVAKKDCGSVMGRFGEKCEETCANGNLLLKLLEGDLRSANCRTETSEVEYTRKDKVSGRESVIDYVLVSSALLRGSTCVDRKDLSSDHALVTYTVPHVEEKPTVAQKGIERWDVSRLRGLSDSVTEARSKLAVGFDGSFQGFSAYLTRAQEGGFTVDAVCDEWRARVVAGAKLSGVTKKKKVFRSFSKKWFDEELKDLVKARQAAQAVATKSGLEADMGKFIDLRTQCRKAAKSKKRAAWNDLTRKLTDEFNQHEKLFYATLDQISGKKSSNDLGPVRDAKGVLRFEETEKREAFASFYEKLGQPVIQSRVLAAIGTEGEKTRFDDDFFYRIKRIVKRRAQLKKRKKDVETLISTYAVKMALEALKLKACGGDLIPPDFLKFGGEAMVESLVGLFNFVLDAGTVPQSWGKALVVLLFKKGEKSDPGNYRGISLLDIVGKVFAKTVATKIEAKVTFAREQAGFTTGRGCERNLHVALQALQRRKRQGKDTFLFFLDVRKAFDTVWRDGLLFKLWNMGVRGKLWHAVRAMYANNKTSILVNGVPTRMFDTLQGVRQGATESPLMFKIFIDGLVAELRKEGLGIGMSNGEMLDGLLFADDIVLFAKTTRHLQTLIRVVEEYSRKWRFEENLGKCGIMAVRKDGKEEKTKSLLFLGREIPRVTQYRYLGVEIHHSLGWDAHCKHVLSKAEKAEDKYTSVFANRSLPVKMRLNIYKQFVRPNFDYASGIWFPSAEWEKQLERCQLRVLKKILHVNRRTSDEGVRNVLGVVPLSLRRARFIMSWFAKLVAAEPDSLLFALKKRGEWSDKVSKKLKKSIERRLKIGRSERRVLMSERKTKSWSNQLERAAERLGVTLEQIEQSFNDETVERTVTVDTISLHVEESKQVPPVPTVAKILLRNHGFVATWMRRLRADHLNQFHAEFEGLRAEAQSGLKNTKLDLFTRTMKKPVLDRGLSGYLQGANLIRLRLRLGTHALRSDLHHRDNGGKTCRCCKDGPDEDVAHFLLDCRAFKNLRKRLIADLRSTSDEWGKMHWNTAWVSKGPKERCALLLGYPIVDTPSTKGLHFRRAWSTNFVNQMYTARSKIIEESTMETRKLAALEKKRAAKEKQAASRKANKKAAEASAEAAVKEQLRQGERPGLYKYLTLESKTQVHCEGGSGRDQDHYLSGGGGGVRSSTNSFRAGSLSPIGDIEC
jgi:exonuclease III